MVSLDTSESEEENGDQGMTSSDCVKSTNPFDNDFQATCNAIILAYDYYAFDSSPMSLIHVYLECIGLGTGPSIVCSYAHFILTIQDLKLSWVLLVKQTVLRRKRAGNYVCVLFDFEIQLLQCQQWHSLIFMMNFLLLT